MLKRAGSREGEFPLLLPLFELSVVAGAKNWLAVALRGR